MNLENHAADVIERFQRAVVSVRNDVKGLPHDVASERLLEAMRDQDVYVPRAIVRRVARQLSDPWWHVRHPLRTLREMRTHEEDTEGIRIQAEASELRRRVGTLIDRIALNSLSIQSRRTVDGQTHVVHIDPWSASMTRRIVDAAAPISVEVRPMTPN